MEAVLAIDQTTVHVERHTLMGQMPFAALDGLGQTHDGVLPKVAVSLVAEQILLGLVRSYKLQRHTDIH
jgi:hypothetical protein